MALRLSHAPVFLVMGRIKRIVADVANRVLVFISSHEWLYVVLWLLSLALPLYYMHSVAQESGANIIRSGIGVALNAQAVALDSILLTTIFALPSIVFGRGKVTDAVRWIMMLAFVAYFFANVLYARFFHTYFSVALIGEAQNLAGIGSSIMALVSPCDVAVCVAGIATAALAIHAAETKSGMLMFGTWRVAAMLAGSVLLMAGMPAFSTLRGGIDEDDNRCFPAVVAGNETLLYRFERETYAYRRGLVCLAVRDGYSRAVNKRGATADELLWVKEGSARQANAVNAGRPQNIVLVIAESLNSAAVTATCNGRKVMPFLSSVVNTDTTAICNLNVKSSIRYGQSSDGQLLYLTGLLPHSVYTTVMNYIGNTYHGLGSICKSAGYATAMVIPTIRTFWRQDEACIAYGIDSLYSTGGTDERFISDDDAVFHLSETVMEQHSADSLFITILTATTHTPYNTPFKRAEVVYHDTSVPADIRNYYSKCTFLDTELRKFIGWMKKTDRYENTMIIVASDHPAPELTELADARMPLIILNPGVAAPALRDMQACQQDIYPTLLDLLGLHVEANPLWRGLGYSMFDKDPAGAKMSEDEQQRLSDVILETDGLK